MALLLPSLKLVTSTPIHKCWIYSPLHLCVSLLLGSAAALGVLPVCGSYFVDSRPLLLVVFGFFNNAVSRLCMARLCLSGRILKWKQLTSSPQLCNWLSVVVPPQQLGVILQAHRRRHRSDAQVAGAVRCVCSVWRPFRSGPNAATLSV